MHNARRHVARHAGGTGEHLDIDVAVASGRHPKRDAISIGVPVHRKVLEAWLLRGQPTRDDEVIATARWIDRSAAPVAVAVAVQLRVVVPAPPHGAAAPPDTAATTGNAGTTAAPPLEPICPSSSGGLGGAGYARAARAHATRHSSAPRQEAPTGGAEGGEPGNAADAAEGRGGPCRSLRSEPVADSCRPAHWGRSSSCLCIEARRGLLDRSIERAGWWSWLARSASGVTVVRAWVRSIDMGCPPRDLPQARSPGAELRCRSTRAHTQSSWRAIVAAIATPHCLCNNPHARNHSSPHPTPDHTPEHREAPGAAFSLPRTYVSESRHAQL